MELSTIITILGIFLSPYLGFVWLYGFVLIKRLLQKELTRKKGLLSHYARLTPEQRMDLQVKGEPTTQTVPEEQKVGWLGTPSPRAVQKAADERVLKEGLRRREEPKGNWQEAKPEAPPPVSRLP